jgi:Asp/Glu/hydantoin racemase
MSVVALIHTSPSMIPVFKPLCDELIGKSARVFNMVDESLLCDIIESGKCPPSTARRLAGHVVAASDAGANVILVTCSSMGPAVEAAKVLVPATVVRADEAMVDRAIATGSRIGIVATLPSTLAPTEALVRSVAKAQAKDVSISAQVVDGAFAAVIGGDAPTHDRLVGDAVRKLAPQSDVILLAQASMARAVDGLPKGEIPIPVLASPRLAVERVAEILRKRAIS